MGNPVGACAGKLVNIDAAHGSSSCFHSGLLSHVPMMKKCGKLKVCPGPGGGNVRRAGSGSRCSCAVRGASFPAARPQAVSQNLSALHDSLQFRHAARAKPGPSCNMNTSTAAPISHSREGGAIGAGRLLWLRGRLQLSTEIECFTAGKANLATSAS